MVFRPSLTIFVVTLLLTACQNDLRSKEQIQRAILDRLQTHSGLDLKALDVTTTAVKYESDKAFATVSFHPKGDPAVNSGMVMKYVLQQRDGKWVVTGVGDSRGGGIQGHPAVGSGAALPPGHPAVDPSVNPGENPQSQPSENK